MAYVPTGKPRGRPRKDGSPPKPVALAVVPAPETRVVVIDSQSPISSMWMHDAKKCYETAEWLETRARQVDDGEGKMLTPIVNALRLAADLRKQSAESLATAQERARAEKTTTAKAGLSILPPQTSRLLANAEKAVKALAAAQEPIDAKEAQTA